MTDWPGSPCLVFQQNHKTARGLLYISIYTFSTRFLLIFKHEQTARGLVHILQDEAEKGVVSKNVVSLKA
mgnify:CR=1 FL=1